MPAQPACPGPNCGRRTDRQRRGQRRADTIDFIVTAGHRADVKRMRAAIALARFPTRLALRAFGHPAGRVGFKRGIRDPVGPGGINDFHVVHQTLSCALEQHLKVVGRADAVVENSGMFNNRPRTLGGFIAVGPVRRQPMITARVDQLEAAPAPVAPLAPTPSRPKAHLVHRDVNRVRLRNAAPVGHRDRVGHRQLQPLARPRKFAAEIPHGVAGGQIRVIGHQTPRVPGHHQVIARPNHRVRRKGEADGLTKLPAGQVHRAGARIVKLHVLVIGHVAERMIHQFVDHHFADPNSRIGAAGRRA